jgi:hypothetical protein
VVRHRDRPSPSTAVVLGLRHYLTTVGFALLVGLAVPEYVDAVDSAEAFRAGVTTVPLVGPALGAPGVADTVYVIGTTGMGVGGLAALVLDDTIPGSDRDRSLTRGESLAESEGAFQPRWRE